MANPIVALLSAGLLLAPALSPLAIEEETTPASYVVDLSSVPLVEDDAGQPAPDSATTPTAVVRPAAFRASNASKAAPEQFAEAKPAGTLLTAPLETNEFAVAGLTWQGADPAAVHFRFLIEGEWSEWFDAEVEDEGTPGTEPLMAAGANGIQIHAEGVDDPADLQLVLATGEATDGSEEQAEVEQAAVEPDKLTPPADEAFAVKPAAFESATPLTLPASTSQVQAASQVPSSVQASSSLRAARSLARALLLPLTPKAQAPKPDVVARSTWGAGLNTWPTEEAPLRGAIVHHTAGSNLYLPEQAPGLVRGIWNYHANTRGWGDIGYNFLVDKYGTIYEGRAGSLSAPAGKMVIGAHARPANTGSVGISVMGNYVNVQPSAVSLERVADIIAWQFARAGVDPNGTFTYSTGLSTAAISGHKDVAATECPGLIYDHLSEIRQMVAKKISAPGGQAGLPGAQSGSPTTPKPPASSPAPAPVKFVRNDVSGQGWPTSGNAWGTGNTIGHYGDLMLRTEDGRLLLYAGLAGDRFAYPEQIGQGWNSMRDLYTGVDFDGDGINDVVGIHKDGRMLLYCGTQGGRLTFKSQIGQGWNFAHVFVLGTGTNGKPAFAGVKANGDLYLYSMDGRGHFVKTERANGNFRHLIGAVAMGDWNGNGLSDAIAIDQTSGKLYWYADIAKDGGQAGVQIGQGWGSFRNLQPASSGNGTHRFYAIRNDGKLFTYTYASVR